MDPHFDGVIFQTHAAELRRRLPHLWPPFVVVDVRPAEEYKTGHISGAVWGGHLDFPRIVPELRRGLGRIEIFVVGRDAADLMAREASLALRRLGAKRVVELTGGMIEWALAGGPLEGGETGVGEQVLRKGPPKMAETSDIILALLDKQWSQAQQSENQRAAMTNYVLLICGGLQGLIVQRGFDNNSLVLGILMLLVGVWGILAAEKYYERFRLSTARIGRWMELLETLDPATKLAETERRADDLHKSRYPRLYKIRLHQIWRWLHLAIAFGAVLNILAILLDWHGHVPGGAT